MNKKILLLLPFLAAGLISQTVSADAGKFQVSYYSDGHGKSDRIHRNHQRHDKHRSDRHRYNKPRNHHQRYDKHRKHQNKAHLSNYVRRHWQQNLRHQKGSRLRRDFYNHWQTPRHTPRYGYHNSYKRYNNRGH